MTIRLKILVVSLYFPPEMGAPAGRFYDFAQHWLKAGHEVTVVTGFPNFPGGIIHERYRGRWSQREDIDGGAREIVLGRHPIGSLVAITHYAMHGINPRRDPFIDIGSMN